MMETMPERADFGLYINFDKGSDFPRRVFQAADQMISAFIAFDHMLAASLPLSIEPVLLLEDIEAGSLLIWLRNALKQTDDQAIKELDWKPQVGRYFVKGKYLLVTRKG
jgi:hypothetical protein